MRGQRDLPVVFVHETPLPWPAASAIQTASMAEAVAAIGGPVYLTGWLKPGCTEQDVYAYYGVAPAFRIVLGSVFRKASRLRSIAVVASLLLRFGRRWVCCTRITTIATLTAWLGVPTVLELHSLPILPRHRRVLPLLARAPGLRRVVVISEALRQIVEEQYPGLARRSLVVAPDAVDLERFTVSLSKEEARRKLGLPLDGPIVGYTGRITGGKGVHVLLQAIQGAAFTTCIVGANPTSAADATSQLQRQYAGPQVIFAGYQDPAKIPLFQRAFDVAVAPFTNEPLSQYNINGRVFPNEISEVMSPLKIFEYMASGTPMVVSDFPVLREVLTPGETAKMVPPGDAAALRRGIEELLQDPSGAAQMAERAWRAVQDYTWEARARRIFADLVQDPGAGPEH